MSSELVLQTQPCASLIINTPNHFCLRLNHQPERKGYWGVSEQDLFLFSVTFNMLLILGHNKQLTSVLHVWTLTVQRTGSFFISLCAFFCVSYRVTFLIIHPINSRAPSKAEPRLCPWSDKPPSSSHCVGAILYCWGYYCWLNEWFITMSERKNWICSLQMLKE